MSKIQYNEKETRVQFGSGSTIIEPHILANENPEIHLYDMGIHLPIGMEFIPEESNGQINHRVILEFENPQSIGVFIRLLTVLLDHQLGISSEKERPSLSQVAESGCLLVQRKKLIMEDSDQLEQCVACQAFVSGRTFELANQGKMCLDAKRDRCFMACGANEKLTILVARQIRQQIQKQNKINV